MSLAGFSLFSVKDRKHQSCNHVFMTARNTTKIISNLFKFVYSIKNSVGKSWFFLSWFV